ncbi:MAG: ATP-grasp domain-containing protein [Lachnospiraceae bacterium]|nr:ATP-grasp domain-containing protein [Lachnospiraceae bacterium]
MFKGLLVYDKADAEYNSWFVNRIIETGASIGLDIKLVTTEEGVGCDILKMCDFAIMRNRNAEMSKKLEARGIKCFNSSYVCSIGNDKWDMYKDFSSAGIPVMYTQTSKLPFPFVLKPRNGHGGKNVFLINNSDEFERVKAEIGDLDNYIYQMKASETGRDIRVYVCGDMILTAIERTAAGDGEFRANFSLGGKAIEHSLTDDELKLAAKVANRIKADFVGIDIIYNNGKPIVNEIEDAVGTRMLYANTDIDAVSEYMDWIKKCLDETTR